MKLITDRFKSPSFYTFMAGGLTALGLVRIEQKIAEGYSLLAIIPYVLFYLVFLAGCIFATAYFEAKQDKAVATLYLLLDGVCKKEIGTLRTLEHNIRWALLNKEVKEHLLKYPNLYSNAITYLQNKQL